METSGPVQACNGNALPLPLPLGLIHTASRAEPNETDSAWKTNLRYEMEAFTLHAEPNRTEPA
jgi:hypothetical protein